MIPQLIFENEDFVAINKPAGMQVHPARPQETKVKKESETLTHWLIKKYPQIKVVGDDPANRPGIVHRLDKDTSGIMLIPKNQEYFLYLKSLFQTSKIKKTYLALVCGVPKDKEGVINKPIGIKDGSIKRSVFSKKMAKAAVTEYKVEKTFEINGEKVSLLRIFPKTGRTHQIRVHLASIGYPILGDSLYGNKLTKQKSKILDVKRQMLHAESIEFTAKTGKIIKIGTEAPEDFKRITRD